MSEIPGFDYPSAILELRRRWTYDQIAAKCGFSSRGSIGAIVRGVIPNHHAGEALYILYVETFGKKPKNKVKSRR